MSAVIGNPLLLGGDGYQISRSVRLRSSASAYFSKTFATSPTSRNKYTFSCWAKLTAAGGSGYEHFITAYYDASNNGYFRINSSNQLEYTEVAGGAVTCQLKTNAVYRDYSAWYHFMVVVDTTQATAANRNILYVNGQQITSFATQTNFALNANVSIGYNTLHNIGQYAGGGAYYYDGYLTETNFIDGQALTAASFGENDAVTGVWKPKKYAGTYGTNGFYLNFSDNSAATAAAIGKDSSGNGNNWTPNNISVTSGVTYDSMLDVPTMYADGGNGRGNYCTLNPLSGNSATITDGNLSAGFNASQGRMGTIAINSGKWYWECSFVTTFLDVCMVGVANQQDPNVFVTSPTGYGYYSNANKVNNSSAVAYGATFGLSDTVGVALDLDAGSLTFYKNGTSQGVAYTGLSGTFCPAFATNGSGSSNFRANFGQRPFAYTPPTGFKALNTQNLPDATITRGSLHMNALLDTGANIKTTANAAYTYEMQWIKDRANANNHQLADTVRGLTAILQSNTTAAETTYSAPSGNSVGWVWNAGSVAVSNTAGSITSQVSANVSAGFSVVTYTGTGANATVGHGLGVAPKMVIVKTRSVGTYDWCVYHANLTSASYYIPLNGTAAQTLSTNVWNATAPTSTVFSIGTSVATNQSSQTVVAYCFSEVAGYSKFGSYTGNGSADGPFVYCGFRPRYVLIKNASDGTGQWIVNDSARGTYNQPANALYPNLSNAEDTSHPLDFYANGFKPRSSAAHSNGNGNTIIYAAFAENPFKNSLAR